MEQVFELVNIILRRDRNTRKRDLNVRDYKVIPLSTQAGIMEFVGNSSSLADILDPLHVRYVVPASTLSMHLNPFDSPGTTPTTTHEARCKPT